MKIIKQASGTMNSMTAVSGSTSTPMFSVFKPCGSHGNRHRDRMGGQLFAVADDIPEDDLRQHERDRHRPDRDGVAQADRARA